MDFFFDNSSFFIEDLGSDNRLWPEVHHRSMYQYRKYRRIEVKWDDGGDEIAFMNFKFNSF